MPTFAIGDIHGCEVQLRKTLSKIDELCGDTPKTIITLGDYIDRGPNSKGVLDLVMSRADIIPLMGNHEQMFVEAYDFGGQYLYDFLSNGGGATLASFGVDDIRAVPPEYIWFARNLRLYHEDAVRTFVHAGIAPWESDITQQDPQHLLWIRDTFLRSPMQFPKYVVHGHTPRQGGRPEVLPNRLNLDTGCVFTGILCCAVFDDGQPMAKHFLLAGPDEPEAPPAA
jgi:serine/threonine protein phosphatase 1